MHHAVATSFRYILLNNFMYQTA